MRSIINHPAEPHRIEMRELAKYANFLLTNPNLLEKVSEMYFDKISKSDLPIINRFHSFKPDELLNETSSNLASLLRWMANGSILSDAPADALENWQTSPVKSFSGRKIELKDIIGIYDLRRSVLLHFLPQFTQEVNHLVFVSQELGTIFNQLRERLIQQIINLQHQELQKEKEFSTSLINNSVNGVLAFDNEFNITEFNRVLEQWLSRRKADVVGKSLFDVFPRYRTRREGQYLKEVLKGKRVFLSERPLFAQKGRYFEAIITPFFNQDHKITGGLAIIYETTHRKEAEQLIQQKNKELARALSDLRNTSNLLLHANTALEERVAARTRELVERENFLNSIIEQSPVSTWIADASGTLIQANAASLDLFGIEDAAALIGRFNILKEESLLNTPFYQQIEAVFREGEIARFSHEYDVRQLGPQKASNTSMLALVCTIFPIKNKEGRVTNAVIQHEDITEIRKAEQALKQSSDQLKLIADALPVLISYIDHEHVLRFANEEYERWFQKSKDEIVDRHLSEVIGKGSYGNVCGLLNEALGGERVQAETLQDYGNKLGKKHISVTLIPHLLNKRVAGIFALITDISERKKNEKMLKALYEEAQLRNDDLKRINVDLDNFVFSASHDLKSPIANLEGLLSLIAREVAPKIPVRDRKLIELMGTSLSKLKKTIEDLIGITRLQKQGDTQFNEEIAFEEMVANVKEDLHQLLAESKAQLVENYQAPSLHYARSHLRSIFYNLLSNALKYRSPDRQLYIEIETSFSNNDVLLRIKDNGLGMSAAQQEKLFSMFTRMHEHVEGTGIGLYTIKRIIENRGGTISVHSEAGRGTEFLIYFNQL